MREKSETQFLEINRAGPLLIQVLTIVFVVNILNRNKMATEVKLFGKWTYDDVKTKEEISLTVCDALECNFVKMDGPSMQW